MWQRSAVLMTLTVSTLLTLPCEWAALHATPHSSSSQLAHVPPLTVAGDIINVSAYASGGDGSEGSPWTGWDKGTPWGDGRTFWFPSGVYQFNGTLSLTSANVAYRGEAGTILKHTGTQDAVRLDGTGRGPGYMFNVLFEDFAIQGNPGTTNGLVIHNASHVVLRNVRVRGATESAVRALFVILGVFENVVVSANEAPLTPRPKYGITLSCDWNWVNCLDRPTNAVTIINPIVEGVSDIGILLQEAEYNTIIGGTSEGNGMGVYIGVNGRGNKLVNIDLEANAAFASGPCYATSPAAPWLCADAMIWAMGTCWTTSSRAPV